MKRLSEIAAAMKISANQLIGYLKRIEKNDYRPNSKISEELEELVRRRGSGNLEKIEKNDYRPNSKISEKLEELVRQRGNREKIMPPITILSTNELPEEFKIENQHVEDEKIILSNDAFENRLKVILEIDGQEIETIFNDFEAFSICAGMEDRHARHIARTYFISKETNNVLEAHLLAMQVVEKYGTKLLSYLLILPQLPFKSTDATQVFSELDKRKQTQDFPILRLVFKNENDEVEKIQMSYFSEKIAKSRIRNDDVIIVRNQTTGKYIMKISRSGFVVPEHNAKKVIPILQVFVQFSKNSREAILHYGLETGECSICGRELNVLDSIKRGIGPVCVKYL